MKDFPLIRSVRSAVIGTLLTALPLIVFSYSGPGALYSVMLVFYALPVAMCMLGLICGSLPMAAAAGAGLFAMYRAAGQPGLLLGCAYLLPILCCFVLAVALRIPFRQSCPAMILVHVLALAGCYLLLQRWCGGDLYAYAGQAAADALSKWELGDSMLYQLYSTGLISVPESMRENLLLPVLGGYTLSAAARSDMLLSVRTLITELLTASVPGFIVTQSIYGGVGCLLLPLRLGWVAAERRAFVNLEDDSADAPRKPDFPDLHMPGFETWHIPRGLGWQVGAALAAGYFLRASVSAAVSTAGVILYAAASAVFTIQGAALLNFMQKRRGTKRFWRMAVPLLLMMLSVLVFLGIFDQISNARGLRKPRDTREDRER